jgi:hypothetical protein
VNLTAGGHLAERPRSRNLPAAGHEIRAKVRRASELAALVGADQVEGALGLAAEAGRFVDGDLESIVDHLRLMGDRASERFETGDNSRHRHRGPLPPHR